MVLQLASCGTQENKSVEEQEMTKKESEVTSLSKIDMSKWLYNSDDNVYYQTGIQYCEKPEDTSYETLAIFVPGDYFSAIDNGNGTYTCEINSNGTVNGYTAETAPVVMPIETPGYSAQAALTDYVSLTEYMDAGFVYVHAGCRGREAGAPAGVTDIKAAIRYLRYTNDTTPGDAEKIFVFGMSGGGAQSALVGATGDSELYEPYLKQIGAVQGVSDAVYGSMDWCPITNLDSADEAYEWMMGVTRSNLSDGEQKISDAMAEAFSDYINQAGIKDEKGNVLTLKKSSDGIYQAGSYYDYILGVIEDSLNNFLSDTKFPYDSSASNQIDARTGRGGALGRADAPKGTDGKERDGREPKKIDGENGADGMAGPDDTKKIGNKTYEDVDDITRTETSDGIKISGTYKTASDYIDALNANGKWVTYDDKTNKAKVTSVSDFVKAFKSVSKGIGAFDQLDAGQGENELFGYGDGNGAHFDTVLADILVKVDNSYAPN